MSPSRRYALAHVALLATLAAIACSERGAPPRRSAQAAATTSSAPAVAATLPPDPEQPTVARAPAPNPTAQRVRPAAPTRSTRRIVFGDVDFTGIGHDRGSPTAPVVVIDLSDFACPYCGEFTRDVYPAIDREYVRTGKVLFKYIPFIAGPFPHAAEATRAAECAAEQGKFWPMLDDLYATQAEWKRGRAVDAQMMALAATLPVDTTTYAACYRNRHTDARTARGTGIADAIGVRVTPSFLVDGNPVQGALPLAEFRKQIETALLLKSATSAAARHDVP